MPIFRTRAIQITLSMTVVAPLAVEAQPSRQLTAEQRQLLRRLVHAPVHPRFTLSALAETAGGAELHAAESRALGEARVELDLAYESRLCRHAAAGAAASLLLDHDEQSPEVDQWLSLCLIGPVPLPSVELDHRLEWHRRPPLTAPRLLRSRRYFKEDLALTITMLDAPISERQARLQFGRTRMGGVFTIYDNADAAAPFRMSVQMTTLRYFRPRFGPMGRADFAVDVLALELEDAQGEVKHTVAGALIPFRLRGLRLWTPHVLLDAAAGVAYGGIAPAHDPERPNAPIPDEDRRQIFTPTFELSLCGGGRSLAGGIGGRRQIWAPLSDEVLIETRATAWVRYRLPGFFALLDGFLALSEVRPFSRGDEDHLTGGGRLQLGWSLTGRERGRHAWSLWFRLSGELARSFYNATQETPAVPPPGLGARVMATVTASYDLGPRSADRGGR